jgi:hypothetical protein
MERRYGQLFDRRNGRRDPYSSSLDAILAQVVANSENLLVRLRLGVYSPAAQDLQEAQARFTDLWRATELQLSAIEAFQEIEWKE